MSDTDTAPSHEISDAPLMSSGRVGTAGMRNITKRTLQALLGIALFVWLLRWLAANVVQPWLWMRQLDYAQIFWGVASVKWVLGGVTFALVFACTWFNLRYARRVLGSLDKDATTAQGKVRLAEMSPRFRVWFSALAAIGLGWKLAARISPQWQTVLNFRWGGSFGQTDPIFGRDVGFYVFSLPFYRLLQHGPAMLLILQIAIIVFVYAYCGCIRMRRKEAWVRDPRIVGHLTLHIVLVMVFLAWGFYLDRFALLYRPSGVVYGVGYTADHVRSVAVVVMALALVLLAAGVAAAFFKRRFSAIGRAVATGLGVYLALVVVLPALVQKYKVQPSELRLETPYLENNIAFTREAFGLDEVEVKAYPAAGELTRADLDAHQPTVDNIRIWDSRSLLPTFRQTQEMRLYYQFYDVDVDRYHLADGYQQVLLSARELARALPRRARTWVNQHLQFTHGYGLVMSFDSKKESEGLPAYVIDDIPPKSSHGLRVEQPALYYGEKTPGYRIVGSSVREFDYPSGDQNVYTRYHGVGGVPLDSLGKRLLFAFAQKDINILLSSYLGPESRIQIWRRVGERVHTVAPFLALDKDPYLVLSEGKLYWIQDAYTVSKRFPYTEPHDSALGRVSYIRNSVKAIVDAYNGSVQLYVVDPQDPILAAYRRAFPGAFQPLSALSPDLKQHLRYPRDLFAVQSDVFKAYHMTDPQVFYNQEDLWSYALKTRPKETNTKYDQWGDVLNIPHKEPGALKPYYILMSLPGSQDLEYVLMTSFTPRNRDNMIGWMAARCDFPHYGQLVVYQLPKESLSYGPTQVQAMISQNTVISQQLSLWDQKGSRVIRGDLIGVPIAGSFLWVEPVYLTSEGLNLPQLKRVIAIRGDRVVMAPTLQQAVEAVVGGSQPPTQATAQPGLQRSTGLGADETTRATFRRAQAAMQKGDWQEFGKAMDELQQMLTPPGGDAGPGE